jgi:hypothetical protein
MELTSKQLIRVEETLKDFICLIPRYREVKDNEELYDMFLSRNRNPLFDLTNTKFWDTGLVSDNAKIKGVKTVKDHYIQRKIAMGIIMEKLSENPNMTADDFVILCKKYASTITITNEEHTKVTSMAKNKGVPNYELYETCNITIGGLKDLISNL